MRPRSCGDLVGQVADDVEIVCDDKDGDAEAGLQFIQEIEYLALDGDIESGRRFISDEQLRPKCQARATPMRRA